MKLGQSTQPAEPEPPMTIPPERPATSSDNDVSRYVARGQNVLVAILLFLFVAVGWRARDPVQIGSGDDLIYLSLSKSLESGSYREVFRASAPLHVKYPPGYPAWLVLVRQVAGDRLDVILATNLVVVGVSLIILFVVARRMMGAWFALALLLLMVLNPGLLWMGGSLYSEALFLFLSSATLAATLRADRSNGRASIAGIAFAVLAFLTRSAGIALVVAVGVWLWSRRKRLELLVYSLASTAVIGGWFVYVALASRDLSARSYANDLPVGAVNTHGGALARLAHRAWENAPSYATGILPTELSLPTIPDTLIDNWLWLGAEVVLLATGIVVFWRTWRAAAAYLVLYGGLLILWPWPSGRLLDPLIPFVLFAMLVGAWRLTVRLPARARILAFGGLVTIMAVGAAAGAVERVQKYGQCDRSNPYASPGCYDAETRSVVAAGEYLRAHAAAGDVVLARQPSGVHFTSGHPAEPAVLLEQVPPGAAARALRDRGILYILLTARHPYERGQMAHALLSSCVELRVEARFAPHALLLTTAVPRASAEDACAALAQFIRENPDDHASDEP